MGRGSHLRLWRARLNVPAMLAEMDEDRVVTIVAAVDGMAALLVISLATWATGLPLLFPALAPTAFILFTRPFSDAAAPRSILLGHGSAIACGWVGLGIATFAFGAPVRMTDPGLALCLSANIGFGLCCASLIRFRCPHPPACATAIIVATGAIPGLIETLAMGLAVVMLTFQGVLSHRLLGVRAPVWTLPAANAPERRAA